MGLFSVKRSIEWKKMTEQQLDVLVIGGGLVGAGIAWDACTRGMKTALLTKHDLVSGASFHSSSPIRNGLSKLMKGKFKQVKAIATEHLLLQHKMPYLFSHVPTVMPIYKKDTYGRLSSSMALYVYDRLTGSTNHEKRKMYGKKKR